MNKEFLKLAVEQAQKSFNEGNFPAGAVIVKNGEVIDRDISGTFPHIHHHAESKLVDKVMVKENKQLDEYEIYTSMASCMMCTGKIYWSGIRRVYYILGQDDVDISLCYETSLTTDELKAKLNHDIVFIQDKTYFDEVLKIYKLWESKIK
ncbi:nucleoside deaminase [Candidatus Dojkabacteria bacterium]|uniref:Nucleoside deaminase n=1 Tax=Candidatus Dojkabacteria bacterium TaxID=2099670 RepID=A0A955IAT0_9BACT|nr:nucleoside deaminase [Candidatus Dojkabacteria bacterium]